MKEKTITFMSDKVKVKTGHRVDNSGEVTFIVGEYMLEKIKDLTTIIDKNLIITVKIEENDTDNFDKEAFQ